MAIPSVSHPLCGAYCSSAMNHTFPMQCTALHVGPARPPAREHYYSAHVVDFDALRPYAVPCPLVTIHGSTGPYRIAQFKKAMVCLLLFIFQLHSACCRGSCIRTLGAVRSGVCEGAAG